jgi:uncharacterized protein YndB with AHSA1/START domain
MRGVVIEVSREATIAATPAEVWRLVDDPARLPEWFTFAERAEVREGEGFGRRQRIYGRWGKKQSEIDQLVTAYEPERLLEWRHEAERLDGKPAPRFAAETRFAIRLEPAGAGTRVVLHSRQRPAGLLRGFVLRLFAGRQVGQQLERSLERIAETTARA